MKWRAELRNPDFDGVVAATELCDSYPEAAGEVAETGFGHVEPFEWIVICVVSEEAD